MFLIESPDGLAMDASRSTAAAASLALQFQLLAPFSGVQYVYMRRFFPDRSLSALGVVQVVIHQYNPPSFTRKSL
jgi:hypothetical protein